LDFSESMISPFVVTDSVPASVILAGGESLTGGRERLILGSLLGLLLGLASGIGYAFFRASQDLSIRTARQLNLLVGEPPIGVLTAQLGSDPQFYGSSTPHSQIVQDYQALRTNLIFGLPDIKVVTIIAADRSGSSIIVGLNLARAIAQAGKSVVVLDTSHHEDNFSTTLGLNFSPGLSDILLGECTVQDAIQILEPERVSVILNNREIPNYPDLLSFESFTTLIRELRDRFSYVVVVAPYATTPTGAAVVASRCDGALLLIHHGETTTIELNATMTSILQVGVPIAGIIIEGVPADEVNHWKTARTYVDQN
jgi:capsular exopolysaccharide synthesis family protein